MVATISLLAILFVLVVFAWVLQLWKSRRVRKMVAHLPCPPTVPFFGHALQFIGSTKDVSNAIFTLPKKYATPFCMFLGYSRVFITSTSPEEMQIVCNSSKAISKCVDYHYLKPIFRNGLFSASGPIWKKHRRSIVPTFNQKILNNFVEVFTKQANILVHQLKKEVGGGSFDIFRYLCTYSVDSICETTMGVQVNTQIEESPFLSWVNRAMAIGYKRLFNIWLRVDLCFQLTPYAKEERDVIQKIQDFIDKIIKHKKEEYSQQQSRCEDEQLEVNDDPKCLSTLDVMLKLVNNDNNAFTDEQLRDEVTTIVIGGSDTTAVTLGFILIILGMYPDCQEKVYEEVMDVLGPDGTLHHEDLKRLSYTERVIKESMRIFPVAPIIGRSIEEDITLPSYTLPAGSTFVAHIFAMHRDPVLYPEPLKFDPDRFLPEEVAKRNPYAHMPFSAGPRNCIGKTYAMMQMKTTIAYLVRKFKFMTEYKNIEDVELKVEVVMKPVRGCLTSIVLRK